jgi:hypothetical protein
MARRLRPIFLLLAFPVFLACAQAQTSSADVDARVDSLLKKLTLDEKIDLIGGVDDFYTTTSRAIRGLWRPETSICLLPVRRPTSR